MEGKNNLSGMVAKELIVLGLSPGRLGYAYVLEAIVAVMKDEELLYGITKVLYPYLARYFGTSAHAVERAIRTAITDACNIGNDNLRRFVGFEINRKLHFTNKEFIFKTVNDIKRQLEISNNDEY